MIILLFPILLLNKIFKITLDKIGKIWYNIYSESEVITMAIIMNRVANKNKRALKFEDLDCGDIFMNSVGNWYMKIYDIYDSNGDYDGNAIKLDNSHTSFFDDTETVTKLKKDLTIDYSNDDITEWYDED